MVWCHSCCSQYGVTDHSPCMQIVHDRAVSQNPEVLLIFKFLTLQGYFRDFLDDWTHYGFRLNSLNMLFYSWLHRFLVTSACSSLIHNHANHARSKHSLTCFLCVKRFSASCLLFNMLQVKINKQIRSLNLYTTQFQQLIGYFFFYLRGKYNYKDREHKNSYLNMPNTHPIS